VDQKPATQEPSKNTDRYERLSHVRHLQTLRWAYLSTYLLSVAWLISTYFDNSSTLSKDRAATLALSAIIFILGLFLGIRIRQFTYLIKRDLVKVGTTVRTQGYLEYVFVFSTSAAALLFGILVYAGIIRIAAP
jgi:hypothetical protein